MRRKRLLADFGAVCTKVCRRPVLISTLFRQTHNRFLAGSSDSESEDDRKVQLRSNRDKCFHALYQSCEEIRVSLPF